MKIKDIKKDTKVKNKKNQGIEKKIKDKEKINLKTSSCAQKCQTAKLLKQVYQKIATVKE